MKHIYCLIFLVIFIAEINLVKSWRYHKVNKADRRDLTGAEIKNFQNAVKEFLNNVTLTAMTRFWKEKYFRDCYKKESHPYNMALQTFQKESIKQVDYYWKYANAIHLYLIQEIKDYLKEVADLLKNVKNDIFLKTEEKNFEVPVKNLMQEYKSKIEKNLMLFHKNVLNIKYTSRSTNEKEKLQSFKINIYIELGKVEAASITFINDIKKCMKI